MMAPHVYGAHKHTQTWLPIVVTTVPSGMLILVPLAFILQLRRMMALRVYGVVTRFIHCVSFQAIYLT
jgi:hypothetical protein